MASFFRLVGVRKAYHRWYRLPYFDSSTTVIVFPDLSTLSVLLISCVRVIYYPPIADSARLRVFVFFGESPGGIESDAGLLAKINPIGWTYLL